MEELHRRAPCTGFWKRIWEKLKLEAFVSSCTLSKDGYNTCHLSCFVVPCAQRWHGGTKVCFVRGQGKLRWLDFLSPMQHHHGAQRSNWSMHRQCGPESAISTEDYHRLSMTVSSKVHLFRHLNFLDTQSMNVLLSFQSNPIFDDYIYIYMCCCFLGPSEGSVPEHGIGQATNMDCEARGMGQSRLWHSSHVSKVDYCFARLARLVLTTA